MFGTQRLVLAFYFLVILPVTLVPGGAAAEKTEASRTLRVVLIPADGGTEDGTRADFQPVFNAVGKMAGYKFDLRVGQSYGAAVEALCSGAADIAFLGPVTFVQAQQQGCAELLAVEVSNGKSTYYSGIFVKRDSGIQTLEGMKGRSVALGDINSASSFVFPVSMLIEAGLDPVRDLGSIQLTGSHANSLAALQQGQADAAALSFVSFERAARRDAINVGEYRVLSRSIAIPNPPLALRASLPEPVKQALRTAFEAVADAPGVSPEMIRGYGGAMVERYDAHFDPAQFEAAEQRMKLVNDTLKAEILRKAAERRSGNGQ